MSQQDRVQAIYNSAFAPGKGARLDLPKKQLQMKGLSLLHNRVLFCFVLLTRKHSDTKPLLLLLFSFVLLTKKLKNLQKCIFPTFLMGRSGIFAK